MYSVQIYEKAGDGLLDGKWAQIRVFDGGWMGTNTAKHKAIQLAAGCTSPAIVEEFAPGGTTSRGIVYRNHASNVAEKAMCDELALVAESSPRRNP